MATSVFAHDSRGTTQPRAMAEMNITPLVDVMLVLLIIFMVAAPMATRSIEMRLPQASPRPQTEKPPQLELLVQGEGRFILDGAVLTRDALAAVLAQTARTAPDTVVNVRVSEDADYQAFTTAIATTRRSGLSNVALQEK
ncbi:ExbD/TolR family protein [Lysobacter solisilvae (ex Woo and Kim 2020)]|uniref:Biopolymer transporter ExbD n=1 Tax=Agrilutibacter terrestris TaxID=2865112 RepID=A0A7H0G124_9GAMM|nr:biopolymer transporter ExbD [Lysobacter terrestris]QNP41990.1 biopolymer transporter ExbD [Lysobacter terrestris]